MSPEDVVGLLVQAFAIGIALGLVARVASGRVR